MNNRHERMTGYLAERIGDDSQCPLCWNTNAQVGGGHDFADGYLYSDGSLWGFCLEHRMRWRVPVVDNEIIGYALHHSHQIDPGSFFTTVRLCAKRIPRRKVDAAVRLIERRGDAADRAKMQHLRIGLDDDELIIALAQRLRAKRR